MNESKERLNIGKFGLMPPDENGNIEMDYFDEDDSMYWCESLNIKELKNWIKEVENYKWK